MPQMRKPDMENMVSTLPRPMQWTTAAIHRLVTELFGENQLPTPLGMAGEVPPVVEKAATKIGEKAGPALRTAGTRAWDLMDDAAKAAYKDSMVQKYLSKFGAGGK